MNASTIAARYGRHAIFLHWLTVVLVAIVYAAMELRGFFPRGSTGRALMRATHVQLGTFVFLLTAVRLFFRVRTAVPAITPSPAAWTKIASGATHVALYALLLAMPVIGWLILNAEGRAVAFLGIEWPALIAADAALAERLEDLHETIANIGYFLIGLHAVAALAHHYWWRDDTLRRMWPRRAA